MKNTLMRILKAAFSVLCFAAAFAAEFSAFTFTVMGQWRVMMSFDKSTEIDGTVYAGGGKPSLTVYETENMQTYVEITRMDTSGKYETLEVEGKLEMEFEEGRYRVLPYAVDETGGRLYPDGYPLDFVYDNTPPSNPVFEADPGERYYEAPDREDYDVFTAQKTEIRVRCSDDNSGVDSVYMETEEGVVKCDSLVIDEGGKGSIRAFGIDRCGNQSSIVTLNSKIFVDSRPPESQIERWEDDKAVRFTLKAEDRESGIRDIVVKWNGKVIKKVDFSSDTEKRDYKKLDISIENERIGLGDNELEMTCRDFAGNSTGVRNNVFREDRLSPRIRIGGVEDGAIVRGEARIEVDVEEEYPDPDNSFVRSEKRSRVYGDCDQELKLGDELLFNEDGRYQILIRAVDKAGNTSERRLGFTIDNTPPLIKGLDKYDGKSFEYFCLDSDPEDFFFDDNLLEGELYLKGERLSGYERIAESGHYVLEARGRDAAGNSSDLTVEFDIGKDATEAPETISAGEDDDIGTFGGISENNNKEISRTTVTKSLSVNMAGNESRAGDGEDAIYIYVFIAAAFFISCAVLVTGPG